MNDLKEEKGTREELRRSQAAPRRSGGYKIPRENA